MKCLKSCTRLFTIDTFSTLILYRKKILSVRGTEIRQSLMITCGANFLKISTKNICCGQLVKLSQQYNSNKYSQHMLLRQNNQIHPKIILTFLIPSSFSICHTYWPMLPCLCLMILGIFNIFFYHPSQLQQTIY